MAIMLKVVVLSACRVRCRPQWWMQPSSQFVGQIDTDIKKNHPNRRASHWRTIVCRHEVISLHKILAYVTVQTDDAAGLSIGKSFRGSAVIGYGEEPCLPLLRPGSQAHITRQIIDVRGRVVEP